jgi:hypothetical protein
LKDVVGRIIAPPEEKSGGGGGCCGGDESPEQKVTALIPRLNEIAMEVVNEICEKNTMEFNKMALVESIAKFTKLFPCLKGQNSGERRKVTMMLGVEGTAGFQTGDMLSIKVSVERNKAIVDKDNRMWLACANKITHKTSMQEFSQNDDIVQCTIKTVLDRPGSQKFQVYVFDGEGEFSSSFEKEI